MSETSTLKPWYATGKIQWGGNPFGSLALDWCDRCQMEIDTDTEAHYRGGIYSYRRWCCRCGKVLKFGAYQVPLIHSDGMRPAQLQWLTKPEQDRR